MRLFIAIPLQADFSRAVQSMQAALRRQGLRGSYTPPENLHLTLAFIGEYPSAEPVLEVLEGLDFEPFRICLRGIGAFGDLWWAGVRDDDGALSAMAARLRRALARANIPFDRKRFSPHITLVRRGVPGEGGPPAIRVPGAAMQVRRAALFRSDRGRGGMIYTELE